MRVHAAGPRRVPRGAHAAADRLVVAELLVPEEEVVHRALAGPAGLEGLEDHVGDALARLDVPAHHRGVLGGIQQRPGLDPDVDGREAALVQRDVVVRQQAAEAVDRRGVGHRGRRIEVAQDLEVRLLEVEDRGAVPAVDGDLQGDPRAVVEEVLGLDAAHLRQPLPQGEVPQHLAHRRLRIGLDVDHVGLHHIDAVLAAEVSEQLCAPRVRGDLSLQVREVVGDAARARAASELRRLHEELRDALLLEDAVLHELEGHDLRPLVVDAAAKGRHRAGHLAAHVGVVAARRREEARPRVAPVREDGRDDGDVREVRAARDQRVVGDEDVAVGQPALLRPVPHLELDRLLHGAQVDREVRRVRHQAALRVEDGAGEVEPLLDVDRDRGPLQAPAHLLRDAHEAVGEQAEPDRVQLRRRLLAAAGGHVDDQVALGRDLRHAARLHNHRGHVLHHDGGPLHAVARLQVSGPEDAGGAPAPLEVDLRRLQRRGGGQRGHILAVPGLRGVRRGPDRAHA
mmetsp:Transcript_96225/g.207639  ORF Transcript_96225/g.207639 Transcript_96225/m.207639 type:complete len:513 (+) Transcript_96225:322-1860(+)